MSPVRVDLHIHSTASDGRWYPEQLVEQVAQTGIDLFAVADHDTVDSVRPAERLAVERGIDFIRAVEINATIEGQNVHILGYGITPEDPDLQELLARNRDKMAEVDHRSIQTLIDAGYAVSHEACEAYKDDPSRGGWPALNYLIDEGLCSGVKDFFGQLFAGDMAIQFPDFGAPDEAVRTIHAAGGIAIWAHPSFAIRNGNAALLPKLVDCGIAGFECYSPYHTADEIAYFAGYCQTRGLLITAGSDCHGGFVGRALGQPEAYLDDLELGPIAERVVR
jgi:predicted metal-dependent phosphoesterase TrpH